MANETTSEVIEISLEKKIETDLVKSNVTKAVIASLKEKYGSLKLKSLDDKESYLELKEAAKECSKLRNLAKKICTSGREDAVKVQKLWVAKEKEVVGEILAIETPLDEEISKFDAEVERIKVEEKNRQEEAYMHRTQSLTKMGAVYSNNEFTLGEFSIESNLVKDCSQEVWESDMLPKFQEQYQIIEAERIAEEQRKAAEAAELKRKQDELVEQQRKFQEEQAEFKRKQDEAARIERERIEEENREKLRLQNELQNTRLQKLMPFNPYAHNVNTTSLWALSEEEFVATLNSTKETHELAEANKQKQISEAAAAKERERLAEESRLAEIKRQQEEQRKAEELAAAGDKANWENFIEQVSKLTYPTLKSGRYLKIGAIAKEKLEEILSLKP